MGRPKLPQQPPPPPPPADPADTAVQERRRRERYQQLALVGRAAMFQTGPSGLTAPPPTAPKTLLGS